MWLEEVYAVSKIRYITFFWADWFTSYHILPHLGKFMCFVYDQLRHRVGATNDKWLKCWQAVAITFLHPLFEPLFDYCCAGSTTDMVYRFKQEKQVFTFSSLQKAVFTDPSFTISGTFEMRSLDIQDIDSALDDASSRARSERIPCSLAIFYKRFS